MRRIFENGDRRNKTARQGIAIVNRLETTARLAWRRRHIDLAELLVVIILASYQSTDAAALRVDRYQAGVRSAVYPDGCHVVVHGLVGRFLPFQVQGRLHLVAGTHDLFLAVFLVEFVQHHLGKVRCGIIDRILRLGIVQLLFQRRVLLGLGDIAVRHHTAEDGGLALLGIGLVAGYRGVIARSRQHADQHGALGKIQLGWFLVEIRLGSILDAERILTEVHGVQIHIENLILGVVVLDRYRDGKCLVLPQETPVAR